MTSLILNTLLVFALVLGFSVSGEAQCASCLTLPLQQSIANSNPAVSISNSSGIGILGESKLAGRTEGEIERPGGAGVVGQNQASQGIGVKGIAGNGTGVRGDGAIAFEGWGDMTGVDGHSRNATGYG